MAAASSGVTNSLSRAQIGQKESLRVLVLRVTIERLRSMVISVVRLVVRVFIDIDGRRKLSPPSRSGYPPSLLALDCSPYSASQINGDLNWLAFAAENRARRPEK